MAIALVTHVAKTSSGTSSSIDTTGATLLLVGVGDEYNGTDTTVTDSKSNTYTRIQFVPLARNASCQVSLWGCINGTVGSGHTFTVTAASTFPSFCVTSWSGASGGIDLGQKFNTATATSIAPGSVTPLLNNSLVVAVLGYRDTTTVTVNASMTISDQNPFSGGVAVGSAFAYLIQTSAAACNPTLSWTNSVLSNAAIAVFEPTVSAGGSGEHSATFA